MVPGYGVLSERLSWEILNICVVFLEKECIVTNKGTAVGDTISIMARQFKSVLFIIYLQ